MDEKNSSRPEWEGKGYSFFQNRQCEYFPCHSGIPEEEFSCLFCYCPLYALGDACGGACRWTVTGFKDCGGCLVPHRRGNYGRILEKYKLIADLAASNRKKDE